MFRDISKNLRSGAMWCRALVIISVLAMITSIALAVMGNYLASLFSILLSFLLIFIFALIFLVEILLIKCTSCGKRYYSTLEIFWPNVSKCSSCGAPRQAGSCD